MAQYIGNYIHYFTEHYKQLGINQYKDIQRYEQANFNSNILNDWHQSLAAKAQRGNRKIADDLEATYNWYFGNASSLKTDILKFEDKIDKTQVVNQVTQAINNQIVPKLNGGIINPDTLAVSTAGTVKGNVFRTYGKNARFTKNRHINTFLKIIKQLEVRRHEIDALAQDLNNPKAQAAAKIIQTIRNKLFKDFDQTIKKLQSEETNKNKKLGDIFNAANFDLTGNEDDINTLNLTNFNNPKLNFEQAMLLLHEAWGNIQLKQNINLAGELFEVTSAEIFSFLQGIKSSSVVGNKSIIRAGGVSSIVSSGATDDLASIIKNIETEVERQGKRDVSIEYEDGTSIGLSLKNYNMRGQYDVGLHSGSSLLRLLNNDAETGIFLNHYLNIVGSHSGASGSYNNTNTFMQSEIDKAHRMLRLEVLLAALGASLKSNQVDYLVINDSSRSQKIPVKVFTINEIFGIANLQDNLIKWHEEITPDQVKAANKWVYGLRNSKNARARIINLLSFLHSQKIQIGLDKSILLQHW